MTCFSAPFLSLSAVLASFISSLISATWRGGGGRGRRTKRRGLEEQRRRRNGGGTEEERRSYGGGLGEKWSKRMRIGGKRGRTGEKEEE